MPDATLNCKRFSPTERRVQGIQHGALLVMNIVIVVTNGGSHVLTKMIREWWSCPETCSGQDYSLLLN